MDGKKPQKKETQLCASCKGTLQYVGKLKDGVESVELYRCKECGKEFTNYELREVRSKEFVSSRRMICCNWMEVSLKCRETELNRRRKDFQSFALPTELSRHPGQSESR